MVPYLTPPNPRHLISHLFVSKMKTLRENSFDSHLPFIKSPPTARNKHDHYHMNTKSSALCSKLLVIRGFPKVLCTLLCLEMNKIALDYISTSTCHVAVKLLIFVGFVLVVPRKVVLLKHRYNIAIHSFL